MATQSERRARARGAILETAGAHFAERGYPETSVDEIAAAIQVTKGSIYHYFPTKEALFEAVFRNCYEELAPRVIAAAAAQTTPAEQLRAGFGEFLKACLNPKVRRILLVDGPLVLGWQRWRAIDSQYFLDAVANGLEAALPRNRDPQIAAHLLVGAVDEAALLLSTAEDPVADLSRVSKELDRLIESIVS